MKEINSIRKSGIYTISENVNSNHETLCIICIVLICLCIAKYTLGNGNVNHTMIAICHEIVFATKDLYQCLSDQLSIKI